MSARPEPPVSVHRLVATGASNLARLALPLLEAMRAKVGGEVDAHFALGRGRSYGVRSSLLGRGLGGIVHSRLWNELGRLPRTPTTALLADVGNDLLYGVRTDTTLQWAETCVQRMRQCADDVVVLGLPLARIQLLRAWQFGFVRRVLVPGSRLTLEGAIAGSHELEDGLRAIASRQGARFVELPLAWYGFDPVHVRRRHWRAAARAWLDVPPDARAPGSRVDGALARLRFLFAAPDERMWFGRTHRTAQPVRRFARGSTVSLW